MNKDERKELMDLLDHAIGKLNGNHPEKGIDMLIDYRNNLSRDGRSVEIRNVGDGGPGEALRNFVSDVKASQQFTEKAFHGDKQESTCGDALLGDFYFSLEMDDPIRARIEQFIATGSGKEPAKQETGTSNERVKNRAKLLSTMIVRKQEKGAPRPPDPAHDRAVAEPDPDGFATDEELAEWKKRLADNPDHVGAFPKESDGIPVPSTIELERYEGIVHPEPDTVETEPSGSGIAKQHENRSTIGHEIDGNDEDGTAKDDWFRDNDGYGDG